MRSWSKQQLNVRPMLLGYIAFGITVLLVLRIVEVLQG